MKLSFFLFVAVAGFSLPISVQAANVLVNSNFDAFSIGSGTYNSPNNSGANPNGYIQTFGSPGTLSRTYLETAALMGWRTTASSGQIEIWQSGHSSVPSASGIQFAEINANEAGSLFQDVQITTIGLVDYSLSHRGRSGTDVMNVSITYLGADNTLGGGDDIVQVNTNYSTGNTAWANYAVDNAFTSVANGTYRFAFSSVSSAGGNATFGNFIDNISFGVDAVPEPSVALLSGIGLLALLRRRRN